MKKVRVFVIFQCCILFFNVLIGCENNLPTDLNSIQYKALETGDFYPNDGGKHALEYSNWSSDRISSFQSDLAPVEKTVVFNGVEYTGLYDESSVNIPNIYISHTYKGKGVMFDINSKTGELTSIMFTSGFSDYSSKSEKECREIVDNIAAKYINLDEYKVEISISPFPESNYFYSANYFKEIDGYKTADKMTVTIDRNGNLRSLNFSMLGSFKDEIDFPINSLKITETLDNKISSIYQGVSKYNGYEILSAMLVKLEDGSTALLYNIGIDFVDKSEEESEGVYIHYSSFMQLLIVKE